MGLRASGAGASPGQLPGRWDRSRPALRPGDRRRGRTHRLSPGALDGRPPDQHVAVPPGTAMDEAAAPHRRHPYRRPGRDPRARGWPRRPRTSWTTPFSTWRSAWPWSAGTSWSPTSASSTWESTSWAAAQLQRFSALNDGIGHQAPEATAFAQQDRRDRTHATQSGSATPGSTPHAGRPERLLDVRERRLGDAQRPQGATQTQEGGQADREVEHLGVAEHGPQALDECVVDSWRGRWQTARRTRRPGVPAHSACARSGDPTAQ